MQPQQPDDPQPNLELYKILVEEYRFQVSLNWNRVTYFLGLDAVILGAGAGFVNAAGIHSRLLLACVFAVGLATAILSARAIGIAHGYYRTARDRMTAEGARLGLEGTGIGSTPGSRGARTPGARLATVQGMLYAVLGVIAAADLTGIVYVSVR